VAKPGDLSHDELACVYAALILIDDDVSVTGDKINAILKAAKIEIEPFWPGLFAKALEGVNARELITSLGGSLGGEAAPAAAHGPSAPAAAAAPVEEKVEKKVEAKEESQSDEDMGLDLFG